MKYVVALEGKESQKIVDQGEQRVIPFVGADREGKLAQMGIGIILPDSNEAYIWGVILPHNLIQSWRGMKIFERVSHIDHRTLCACWYAGERDITPKNRYFDGLAEKLGGSANLQALRDEILLSVPTSEQLESMLTNLREKGIDVNTWELKEEIKAGRIEMTPLIETIIRETEERHKEYQRKRLFERKI